MPHGDRGGTTKKRRPTLAAPTRADKQATVWAAEQSLAPWEVHAAPKPAAKKAAKPESLDHRYRTALAAPVSPKARQRLAQTMTPERRQQHRESYKPPKSPRDEGLLHAITSTPRSIAHTYERLGRGAEHGAAALGKAAGMAILRPAIEAAYGPTPRGAPINVPRPVAAAAAGARLGAETLGEWTVGPQITAATGRAAFGEPVLPKGRGAQAQLLGEAALLPTLFGGEGPLRSVLGKAGEASEGLTGQASRKAVEDVVDSAFSHAAPSRAAAKAASRSRLLRGAEQNELHGLIEQHAPEMSDVAKARIDAHVYTMAKRLPAVEQKQAVADIYKTLTRNFHDVPELGLDEAAQAVRTGLAGAKSTREAMEAGWSPIRGQRFSSGGKAFGEAGGGRAGLAAKKRELAGELPKLSYGGFGRVTPDALEGLLNKVEASEKLTPGEKVRVQDALEQVFTEGRTPTRSELVNLEKVFGKSLRADVEAAGEAAAREKRSLPGTILEGGRQVINAPRAVQSAYDISFLFRQALVSGTRHPIRFVKTMRYIPKAARKAEYERLMDELVSRPGYERAEKAGLATTMEHGEEQFQSELAERIPGVGVSERTYRYYLNRFRLDLFDSLADHVEEAAVVDGRDPEQALKGLAKVVNAGTGRGGLWRGERAAKELNTIFFSPRLVASRLAFMNPVWYAKLPPGARREAVTSAMSLLSVVGTVLWLANRAGADIGINPTSANFAKIRVGNTRVDILGGFGPLTRFLAQLLSGRYTSSTTGKQLRLGSGAFGQMTRADIRNRLLWSKLAPIPAAIEDILESKTITGAPVTWKSEAGQRFLPLLLQDIYAAHQQTGSIPAAAGLGALTALGFGVQSYGPRKKKSGKPRLPYSHGRGGVPLPFSGGGGSGVPLPYAP